MDRQYYSWTCSVCSVTWTLNAMGMMEAREDVGLIMGYPDCVNETYGSMSAQCIIDTYKAYGFLAKQAWVTYEQAYSIVGKYTGCINPIGMQHYMAIRGQNNPNIWVANSAPGYRGIYNDLDRDSFNALGPVQVIYIESRY